MQALLAPLAFGLLLFYALDPPVDALERRRVPRWIGAALMLGLTLGTILGGAYALQDQALTVINELPAGARRISALVERRPREEPGPLEKVEQAAEELAKNDTPKPKPGVVRVQVEEPRVTATSLLWSGSISAFGALNQLIMILFLTYFTLLSDKMFRRKFVELAGPTLTKKKITLEIIDDISRQIGRFLMVQIFTSVVVGVVDVGRAGMARPRTGGVLGAARRRLQFHSLLRTAPRQRRLWRSWHSCSSARST